MSKRGRPPLGLGHIDRLSGSDQAKARLKVMVDTLTGEKTVAAACFELGLSEARFHELRDETLAGAISLLEPKPLGRPPTPGPTDAERELLRLQKENRRLKLEAHAAVIREEIAMVMPHVLQPRIQKKTKDRSSPDSRKDITPRCDVTPPSSNPSGSSTT